MAVSAEYSAFVLELLEPLDGVSLRRMFGAAGLFCHGVMFGLIAGDRLYFKVGAGNRADFDEAGCGPFTYPTKTGEHGILSYYEAPDSLFDDHDEMLDWARKALDEALRANTKDKAAKKPAKRRK
ncbi:TfoX/Sxy family protein [Emcibacter sp. SYSU 3D8]|uniref:TfoX/Sxy family protein n=1 Tax=Emcibacter sp. SYSU 3D8 TaxID=3133969 RepID=UPI0031FEC8A8